MGEYWLYLEVNEGSYGGRYGKDAMDSVDNLMANTRNNPIEELDMRFPVRCDQYELRPEPAAPGKWRGGIGIIRRNRFLVDGTYSCEGDRQHDPPRGRLRRLGRPRRLVPQEPGHRARRSCLEAKVTGHPVRRRRVHRVPRARTPPATATRSTGAPELVREDVLDDFTTIELARDAYGVVFADERTPRDRRGGDRGAPREAAGATEGTLADRVLRRSLAPGGAKQGPN